MRIKRLPPVHNFINQTIGRAARNVEGTVIMYADTITDSMQSAISETTEEERYRWITMRKWNTPASIQKAVRENLRP